MSEMKVPSLFSTFEPEVARDGASVERGERAYVGAWSARSRRERAVSCTLAVVRGDREAKRTASVGEGESLAREGVLL